ncbi:hypothetical protein Q31b_24230 [Novipirellula aureliae]|uniref:SLA1 homology domain-containing protein n=1 Tax=Novipirellula aureliae TaxID=2527966 RepID=A0A5C6E4H0_9BACT|nr:SHD1 domain-containing protein [Novipirellula aureliae]TWU43384.1 hypothetical protein Q31b_24230 [Novipirellula aureliae]
MRSIILFVLVVGNGLLGSFVEARTWTSATGGFAMDGDAVAFNETTVILKKPNGDLIAVELADLSTEDQDYVKSKEFGETLSKSISEMQTWTSVDGMKIRGRVLAYGRKDLSISRQLGKVVVNGTPFSKADSLHQQLVLKIMSKLEGRPFADERELTQWAKSLGGQPKVYPLEGVLMELESGDKVAVPFFLFASEQREILKPGWQAWLAAEKDEQMQKRESLMMQQEAMAYQREGAERRQIEILRLNLLAAATGATSIWEVGLRPMPGVYGRPTSVMVTAPNSDIATRMAMQNYPGFQLVGVRKASRF